MKWVLLISISLFYQTIFGQELNKIYTLKLKDGSIIYNAQILEINKDVWILNNSILGILQIDKEQIDAIITESGKEIIVSREKLTRFNIHNPVPERYTFFPSAFNLPKNKSVYKNFMLLISGYDYGITENLSAGSTFSTLLIFPLPAISLHTKYSFPLAEKTRLGFQLNIGGAVIPFLGTNFIDSYGVFLPQAMVSFGDIRKNTSLRLGRVDILGTERFGSFFAGASFIAPISGKSFFVTDNIMLFSKEPVIMPSLGFRIVGRSKRGSLDLGLAGVIFISQPEPFLDGTFYLSFQKRLKK